MALGILAGSIIALLVLGFTSVGPYLALLAFAGGMTWVAGNYLLIVAVARAGMARSFIVINFSAVLSFIAGMLFLGELQGITPSRLAMMVGGVGLVIVGAFLVTTTTPGNQGNVGKEAIGGLSPGSAMRKGLLAAFVATIFFTAYNTMTAFVLNRAQTPVGTTFAIIAPGAAVGSVLVALLVKGHGLRDWRRAPGKWHLLAVLQGLVWATAMVCIMFGWLDTGIAMGTPIQVGTQTMVSSLWGIMIFGEFRELAERGGAYLKFGAGAVLTVAGIVLMAFI